MKRLALSAPVALVGLPLLICLLLASTPSPKAPASAAGTTAPAVVDGGAPLPDAAHLEKEAAENPVAFLEDCLRRYAREIKGYHCTMQKQERIDGRLQSREIVDVLYRNQPHSALLHWKEGARKAEAALFVEGENNGKMLARPTGVLARTVAGNVVERDVEGSDARASGRYPLTQFGIRKGTERTLKAWKAAQDRGQLDVKYLGVQKIKEAGDRPCYKLRRAYAAPETDGVTELTIYVDTDTWLQVGSVLKGEGGKLIGEYFFRDIELNPTFAPGQFERSALPR